MSLGFKGPIPWEHAIDYAISTTFSVGGDPNKQQATCKVCGEDLEKGQGLSALIREILGSRSVPCYLCPGCAGRIMTHAAQWAEFQKKRRADDV